MRIGYWNFGHVAAPSIVVVPIMMVVSLFAIAIRIPKLAGRFAARVGLAYIVKPTCGIHSSVVFSLD